MSFEMRPTRDLVQIAAAGGGFCLDATMRPTQDLISVAAAAARHGARVTFRGMRMRQTTDLMLIGAAGKGSVVFEE